MVVLLERDPGFRSSLLVTEVDGVSETFELALTLKAKPLLLLVSIVSEGNLRIV